MKRVMHNFREHQAEQLASRLNDERSVATQELSNMHRGIAVVASDHCYEIRKLHQPVPQGGRELCVECGKVSPCPTVQILNRRLR